ncbi:MAG: chromosome segregation protein SMC [Clostridia bacterium]|nr:chromosome segregation protein SMC [Clostridia bacterium]
MRLKRLYIHGFKSFADKVEITFEHGITGVVGPNGCGKSNIADAIRWVLGEQSAKQLRGSKMEDVIFNGTDKRRRLGWCEVTLTFDNEDHALPIDFTEVAVTRRAYRTGEGEYMINSQPCRLKDIVDLFRDTGTGRDGYSIIGQGRVDEILSQKTDERRQVFEEAAGIVKYKARKTEAEKRLENTAQNLARVSDLVESLEERIEPLRLQSEDARKYLALRDELKGLELNAFILRSQRYMERMGELDGVLSDIARDTAENENARQTLSNQRDDSQQRLETGERESAALRESLQEYIRDVEAAEGSAGVLRERLISYQKERSRLESEKEAAGQGEQGLKNRISQLEAELAQSRETLEKERLRSQASEDELSRKENALRELENRAEEAKEAVIDAMNALGDQRSEQARLSALSQAIGAQIKSLGSNVEKNAEQGAEYEKAREIAAGQLETEKQRLAALGDDAKRISEETHRLGEQFDKLSRESNELLAQRQELSSRAKLLNEMQRDYEGYNLSVKQVLKEAERLKLTSVHGVVANVIHAEQRIEKAVETALGAALQDIIVDSEEDARELIGFLKRYRYGRATFLPISAVRGRTLDYNERRVLSMPGCIGIASEMVTYDPIYKGIAENLLGRTVIAENLSAAIPIHRAGRQSFRLVTLDGDVMNVGGSMTGGSTVSRMTSLLSREREIKETGEKLMQMNARLKDYDIRLKETAQKRSDLKASRQEAYDEFHQQEIAVARAQAHLSQTEEVWQAHSERQTAVVNEKQRLEAQLEEIALQEKELGSRKQLSEESSAALKEEAVRLQGELNAERPRVDEFRERVMAGRLSLAAFEKDTAVKADELKRLIDRQGDTLRMLQDAEENLKKLKLSEDSDRERLSSEEQSLGIARASLNETRAEFEKADKARLAAQEALKAINEKLESLNREAEELSERNHRSELLRQKLESDLNNLTGRIFEDYQLTLEGAKEFEDKDFKLSEGERRITSIKSEIKALGSVNVGAMDEYREVSAKYEELSSQRDDLVKARDDLTGIIDELGGKMEKQFKEKLTQLDEYFGETFTALFGGGQARISLEDPDNALTSGIEIAAQPPGKKLQLLSLLSGGERALTAIAILFAMLKLKPTPFCMLDEIEAALDDANIDNFAEYLKGYSVNTQFVVVTHRKGTMSACDALYGVAMEEKGVSKLMSVKLQEAV